MACIVEPITERLADETCATQIGFASVELDIAQGLWSQRQ
jgi:hypothetical protein